MSGRYFVRVLLASLFLIVGAFNCYATNTDSFIPIETAKEQETAVGLEGNAIATPLPLGGVVLATGNMTEVEDDFASHGEMPIYLRRIYNRQWNGRGLFGRNWLSNFDYSIAAQTAGGVNLLWLQKPDGRRIKFIFNAVQNRWNENKPQPVAYIVRNPDGSYTHFNESRGTERYNADGYVTERRNEQGVAWTFQYIGKYLDRVTHSSGRFVRFVWTGKQVTQVIAPNNASFSYTYTADVFGSGLGRLASSTRPGTPSSMISYHYEDARFPDALTGKTIGGKRYSWFAYDANGRVSSTQHHGGTELHTFAYAVEAVQQVTPPPAPPPPGGYQNDDDRGWCEYRSGEGRICYHPQVVFPDPGTSAKALSTSATRMRSRRTSAVSATTAVTRPRPTLFRVTVTNPLGKQTIYRFDDAKLVSVEGAPSQHYAARYRELSYDVNGYPNLVTDFKDSITDYDYDAQGHLLKKIEAVGKPEIRTILYEWDLPKNRMLKETVVASRELKLQYDAKGRIAVMAQQNLSNNGIADQVKTTAMTYTVGPNGLISKYVSDGPLPGPGDAVTQQYSSQGDLVSASNSLGHTRSFSGHNGLGLPSHDVGLNDEATDYTYDLLGRVATIRQFPNGQAADTKFEYDSAGLLVSTTTPDGHVRRAEYDAAHRLITEFEAMPSGYAYRSFAYNAMSLPTVIKTGTSQYRPDTGIAGMIDGVYQSGDGASVSGWACSFYFDVSVNVHLYVGGPAGTGTIITGVPANQSSEPAVAQACRASGTAYRFSINIEALRAQHGGKRIYIHGISPVGRGNSLIAHSGAFVVPPVHVPPPPQPPTPPPPPPHCGEAECHEPVFAPDPGMTSLTDPGLQAKATPIPYGTLDTVVYVDYDEEGRVRGRRGNDGQDISYAYDDNGNVEKITDSQDGETTFQYDALDRLSKTVDAKLKATEFKYDAGDRLVWVEDPRDLATTYKYDGFGQLWSQVSPDTGTTSFEYDVAGRRIKETRNDGRSVSYTHDDLGRMTMASAPGLARDYYYDNCTNSTYAVGRLCRIYMRDPNVILAHSLFYYFPYGELQARHDTGSGANDITRYAYDDLRRLTRLTYPSGIVANYGYSYGTLASLTATIGSATVNVATNVQYQPFGPAKSWTYGNGLLRNKAYDLDGRLIGISTALSGNVQQSLTYAYNANDLIEALTNGVDAANSHKYEYDELFRLSKDTIGGNPYGNVDKFDAVGNRISRGSSEPGQPPTTQYAISATSNRMDNQVGNATRTFAYAPTGNLQSSVGWLGNRTYDYDAFNRLKSVTIDGATSSYVVNALDQRVAKTNSGGTKRYVYAGQNQLLAQTTPTGWKSYLWLGSELVGVVQPTETLSYVHTDHLGRPEVATNAARQSVWKAVNGSYHRTVTLDSIGGIVLGFPGQIWDEDTDTWYNGFRDYDPYLGRYIQSDPIGLAGGLNTYAYVGGNPVNFIDPLGLSYLDKLFGLPKQFWRWYHRNVKRPGDPDLTREEADALSKEWEAMGKPGPDRKGPKGQQGSAVIGLLEFLIPWPVTPTELGAPPCELPGGPPCGPPPPDLYGEVGPVEDISDEGGSGGGGGSRGGDGGSRGGGGGYSGPLAGGCYGACGRVGTVTVKDPIQVPTQEE
jgi:RHS repeat-associated protein